MYKFERIFELIAEKKIRQKELADHLGISPSVFSDWKKGRIKPGLDVLIEIADYFGVSVDYLLGRTQKKITVEKALEEYIAALEGDVLKGDGRADRTTGEIIEENGEDN